tara:strand:+ start:934 stop:1818 length:885 start_codon:yes stop_codon:yes gene_type:complete
MAKNTFFRHGTRNEQMLQQSLVDEFVKMFGLDILYIPRKLISRDTILNEEVISQFDDAFLTYAYLENTEGFQGAGDILTKFGIRSTDEITLTISRQLYEDFLAIQMTGVDEIVVGNRPSEGDLIFFPLTSNLFEIKFVEHEKPFYQFGKLYTYELKCELFEYSNETAGGDIFESQEDEGFVVKYYYEHSTLSGEPSLGEMVTGSITGITSMINDWNPDEAWIELRAFNANSNYNTYQVGETLTGVKSGFSINISSFNELDMEDAFASNIEFENTGDDILDFTERNPFGEFGNRS